MSLPDIWKDAFIRCLVNFIFLLQFSENFLGKFVIEENKVTVIFWLGKSVVGKSCQLIDFCASFLIHLLYSFHKYFLNQREKIFFYCKKWIFAVFFFFEMHKAISVYFSKCNIDDFLEIWFKYLCILHIVLSFSTAA